MSFDEDIGLCRYDVNAPKPSAGFEDDLHSRGRWIRHRDERQQGSFQHATQSVLAEIARVVAQIGALVGVVAGFWHILWIGVGLLVTSIVGVAVQSAGYTRLDRDQEPTAQEGEEP
jgi:hypothetical protein